MNPKIFCLITAILLVSTHLAEGQQTGKIPRLGFLTTVPFSVIAGRIEAFRRGLQELSYVEEKNIVIDWRSAEGQQDRLGALAEELVHRKVDLIVSAGSPVTRSLKEATSLIPIVMGLDPDPVGNRFVVSLARPGGNITGLSTLNPEISGKQLELLKEIIPKLSRVAVLGSSTRPGNAQIVKQAELAARTLGAQLKFLDILNSTDIETAFERARKHDAEALLVLTGPQLSAHRRMVIRLASTYRLPAMYERPEFTEEGGLVVYGASINDLFHRAATYVDKILKGVKPADLPIEQPTKFEFIINLKTAKQIGLKIPPNVLARADRVIR